MNNLFEKDGDKIAAIGRARLSCEQVLEYMKQLPQVSVALLVKDLNMSAPTARSALDSMERLGILDEITGKKRDKIFAYKRYLKILEEGAEP